MLVQDKVSATHGKFCLEKETLGKQLLLLLLVDHLGLPPLLFEVLLEGDRFLFSLVAFAFDLDHNSWTIAQVRAFHSSLIVLSFVLLALCTLTSGKGIGCAVGLSVSSPTDVGRSIVSVLVLPVSSVVGCTRTGVVVTTSIIIATYDITASLVASVSFGTILGSGGPSSSVCVRVRCSTVAGCSCVCIAIVVSFPLAVIIYRCPGGALLLCALIPVCSDGWCLLDCVQSLEALADDVP